MIVDLPTVTGIRREVREEGKIKDLNSFFTNGSFIQTRKSVQEYLF
jgi:hypothetical protein